MIPLDPGQIVRPHERIPNLWQFAFPAIADGESARDIDEWNPGTVGWQTSGNPSLSRVDAGTTNECVDSRRIGRPVETNCLRRRRGTRRLDSAGPLWMLEGQLPFAHVGKTELVDQGIADGPSMAGVELLVARAHVRTESRDVRSRGLKVVEGLKVLVVGVVVVEAEVLVVVDVVVQTQRELVLIVGARGNGLICDAVGAVRSRHETQ